jgi:hypothetical protein
VGVRREIRRHERLTRHRPHRIEHARVANTAPGDLLGHHSLTFWCEVGEAHGGHRRLRPQERPLTPPACWAQWAQQ